MGISRCEVIRSVWESSGQLKVFRAKRASQSGNEWEYWEKICMFPSLYIYISTANAGDARDPGSIPESRRPLEKEMATHFSILVWKIP